MWAAGIAGNAQKRSDEKLFHSVTDISEMRVVFAWAFVNPSPSLVLEQGHIAPLREHLAIWLDITKRLNEKTYASNQEFDKLITERKASTDHIGEQNPLLGKSLYGSPTYFLKVMIPSNILNTSQYKLMDCDILVDVETQSRTGTTIKHRMTTKLKRMQVDMHDSGWKVIYALDPIETESNMQEINRQLKELPKSMEKINQMLENYKRTR